MAMRVSERPNCDRFCDARTLEARRLLVVFRSFSFVSSRFSSIILSTARARYVLRPLPRNTQYYHPSRFIPARIDCGLVRVRGVLSSRFFHRSVCLCFSLAVHVFAHLRMSATV
jgi:hypothetical protein